MEKKEYGANFATNQYYLRATISLITEYCVLRKMEI